MDPTTSRNRPAPPLPDSDPASAGSTAAAAQQGASEEPAATPHDEVESRLTSNPNASLPASELQAFGGGVSQQSGQNQDNAHIAAAPLWVQRLQLVVLVIFCIELGMLLAVLPWTRVWLDNALLAAHPALRAFAHENFVRGAVTGVGLVDIWIGISEAVHYREVKPGK
jgi:hypothetical protein